jgi:Secreted trypsin-like serine protease
MSRQIICIDEQLFERCRHAYLRIRNQFFFSSENPKSSAILQTVKLHILQNEKFENAFKNHAKIGATQMCVGGQVGHNSCGGDSGGPLMKVEALDGPPRYYLLGVVSFGATTMPGVYIRDSEYMNWIMDNLHV